MLPAAGVNPATSSAAPDRRPYFGPPPPRYYDPDSWRLLSQGAEARIWYVPNYLSIGAAGASLPVVCKERFPKSYRHPSLDASMTKGRTKGEARCLVRCRRAGVPCPTVLGVDLDASSDPSPPTSERDRKGDGGDDDDVKGGKSKALSSCLFLEYIEGCTVREYIEARSNRTEATIEAEDDDGVKDEKEGGEDVEVGEGGGDGDGDEEKYGLGNGKGESPARKRPRRLKSCAQDDGDDVAAEPTDGDEDAAGGRPKMVLVDGQSIAVARRLGEIIAIMHNAGVIHGDLTTSNIMIRNPPSLRPDINGKGDTDTDANASITEAADREGSVKIWESPKGSEGSGDAGDGAWSPRLCLIDLGLSASKGASPEEKAVDLYVLERAFAATHPGSRELVEEALAIYKARCRSGDAVLQRLAQVRLRGRKRECFG